MPGCVNEVLIGTQQSQFMPDAQLGDQRIDRADLHPGLATDIAQICSGDVVVSIRLNQSERTEAADDPRSCLRCNEALQQFLKDQSSRHNHVGTRQRILQRSDLRFNGRHVAPEGQGPDAGIDEQRHLRVRSRL